MGKEVEKALDKICIKRSKISDTKIAECCGIHQSDFSRIRNGKKKLSKENLDKIKNNLELNEEEKAELTQAFNLEAMGKSNYIEIKQIEACIKSLSDVFTWSLREAWPYLIKMETKKMEKMIMEGLQIEHPYIYAVLPFESPIYQMVKRCILRERKKEIIFRHLFQISAVYSEGSLSNIQSLTEILQLVYQADHLDYKPYFLKDYHNSWGGLYPYSILVNHLLLLISADFEHVLVIKDKQVRSDFESTFKFSCKKYAKPFMKVQDRVEGVLSEYEISEKETYLLFYQPCFGLYIKDEHIHKYLNAKDYVALIEQYFEYFRKCNLEGKRKMISLFSDKGVMDFARDGILHEYSTNLVDAFEPEDRITLLEGIKTDDRQLYVKKQFFNLERVTLTVNADKNIIISPIDIIPESGMKHMVISEQKTIDAFRRYFKYVCDNFVESKEKKEEIIDKAILVVREEMEKKKM